MPIKGERGREKSRNSTEKTDGVPNYILIEHVPSKSSVSRRYSIRFDPHAEPRRSLTGKRTFVMAYKGLDLELRAYEHQITKVEKHSFWTKRRHILSFRLWKVCDGLRFTFYH
jgi:hypothetical protein